MSWTRIEWAKKPTKPNTTIATINSRGIATFLKIGTVQFTATTTDGSNKTAITSAIQVIQYVTSIVVNETLTSATTSNTSVTLTATVKPDNANTKTVAWSSSDGAIATINATTGKVTFLSSGKVTFTATAQDGSRVKGNSKEITVTAA